MKNTMVERSLIILKPDCISQNSVGTVLERFNNAGYKMIACKMQRLSEELLRVHYAHHASKPFFPEVVAFMRSTPVLIFILEGENAIDGIRDLLGPTDSTQAPKGTIRGDLGKSKMENIAHASDAKESAIAEIERFFKPEEIYAF